MFSGLKESSVPNFFDFLGSGLYLSSKLVGTVFGSKKKLGIDNFLGLD